MKIYNTAHFAINNKRILQTNKYKLTMRSIVRSANVGINSLVENRNSLNLSICREKILK